LPKQRYFGPVSRLANFKQSPKGNVFRKWSNPRPVLTTVGTKRPIEWGGDEMVAVGSARCCYSRVDMFSSLARGGTTPVGGAAPDISGIRA
jgi:hypothetical protein